MSPTAATILFMAIYIPLMIALLVVTIKEAAKKEKVRDYLTREEAEAFTGENGAYFLDQWKDRPDSFFKGWNWAAAFFAVEWLAYRKMYFWSFTMLPGPLIGFGARGFPVAALFYLGLSRFLSDPPALLLSILLARFIGGGLLGNIWYRAAAIKAMQGSLHMSEPARLEYLKHKGGTNAIAPVIAVLVQAVGIAAFMVLR